MTGICVRVPTVLREATGGEASVLVPATGPVAVASVLDVLASHPALERRLRTSSGRCGCTSTCSSGPTTCATCGAVDTLCVPGDELTVIAAVSGG